MIDRMEIWCGHDAKMREVEKGGRGEDKVGVGTEEQGRKREDDVRAPQHQPHLDHIRREFSRLHEHSVEV